MRRLAPILVIVAMLSGTGIGADRCGEETTQSPTYEGITANAPIPWRSHLRNEGGSDGAGLCVIASILCNGRWQGVPGLEGGKKSALWKAAKRDKGGYSPEKLEALLKETMPDAKWVSWEGEGTDILKAYSEDGYPIGATMNTGAFYDYEPISHMVSLIHLDGAFACVVDSNDPGNFHWMPASEFARRFPMGRKGWGFVWTKKRHDIERYRTHVTLAVASAVFYLIGRSRRSR